MQANNYPLKVLARPSKTYRLSVLVVNFNSGSEVFKNHLNLIDQDWIEYILVDNASSDDSEDYFKKIEYRKNVYCYRLKKNQGFSAGSNFAFTHSSAQLLLFINPDCYISIENLRRLIEVVDNNKNISMVGGHLLFPDGKEQAGGRRLLPTPWLGFVRGFGLYRLHKISPNFFQNYDLEKEKLPISISQVQAISGACMLVKREPFQSVGCWDEGYFLHCEDLDLCKRFFDRGLKIYFVPDVKVVHVKGVSSENIEVSTELHKHRGMIRYFRKYYKETSPLFLWPLVVVGVWLRYFYVISIVQYKKFHRKVFK